MRKRDCENACDNDRKKRTLFEGPSRAGKGFRTLDIDLGKVALYQLSYSRECSKFNKKSLFVKGFGLFAALFRPVVFT